LDALANTSQGEIIVVIVAAAALSCLVGWLLEGGFDVLRERYRGSLASTRAAAGRRLHAVDDDGPREFGDEFVRALAVAVKSSVESAADEQAIIDAIVAQLGWSPTRARWFVAVNRDQVDQAARQMQRDQTSDWRASSG
jgi:hypothetical protein